MKRTLSMITAVALTASCFSAAFADSSNTPPAMPGNGNTSMFQPGSSQSLQTLVTGGIYLSDAYDENALLIDTAEAVTLDDTSTWTLTTDTYITSFTGSASQVISNGYQLYVDGIALTGTK